MDRRHFLRAIALQAADLRPAGAELLFEALEAAVQVVDAVDDRLAPRREACDHERHRRAKVGRHHLRPLQFGHAGHGRELALDRWLARLLYACPDFRASLSLVMFDRTVRQLYAARVSGDIVLADRKPTLLGALGRHLYLGQQRMAALDRS